jgi:hypothetical protein
VDAEDARFAGAVCSARRARRRGAAAPLPKSFADTLFELKYLQNFE